MHKRWPMIVAGLITLPAPATPYNDAGPAVIQLHVYGTLKQLSVDGASLDFHARGTGFLVSPDGLVLSAGHNIPDKALFAENSFYVEGYFPAKDVDALSAVDPPVEIEVIAATQLPYDVALLRIKSPGMPRPYLRLCDAYQKGTKIDFEVLGYQGGDRLLTSNYGPVMAGAGAVSNIVLQMPLNVGNSGGPVFNEQGMVFGIAIGEKTVNGQRMQSTSLAVPMAKVMETLGDLSAPLRGVSYESDCDTQLNHKVRVRFNTQINIDVSRMVYLMPSPFPQLAQPSTKFEPPDGYKFAESPTVYFMAPRIRAQVWMPEDGNLMIARGVTTNTDEAGSAEAIVSALLEQAKPRNLDTSARIQSFSYSKTLDVHAFGITQRKFRDRIFAPKGFLFKEFLNINYVSINHSPSNGVQVKVSEDGTALEIDYSLESGPFYDRWRGWVDAFITAKLVQAPRLD